eukprot:gene1377-11998_t
MSSRYALKALNGLKKTKTMQTLNDLPPSIKQIALKDENRKKFEDEFERIKEKEMSNIESSYQYEYDIRTNKKPKFSDFQNSNSDNLTLEEYKKIKSKLDYTKDYTVEEALAEYEKISEIESPIQQRKEKKRLELVLKKLMEHQENFKRLNLYKSTEDEDGIKQVEQVEEDSLKINLNKLEVIFTKIETLNDSTMMSNFEKTKDIYFKYLSETRNYLQELPFEKQKKEIQNTEKLEKIQKEVNSIMKDYDQYFTKLILKLDKQELFFIEQIFKPDMILKEHIESIPELLKMIEINEYNSSEAGKQNLQEKQDFVNNFEAWQKKVEQSGKQFEEDNLLEAINLMKQCGMNFFENPVPTYQIKTQTSINFDPALKEPRDKKVILEAFVGDFGLSLKAFERFKSIVGKKYSPKKHTLTMRSDLYPDKETNEKYLVQLMMEIINESKKADEGAELGIELEPKKYDQLSSINERMKNVETEDRKADEIFEQWKQLTSKDQLPQRPIYDIVKETIEVREEQEEGDVELTEVDELIGEDVEEK